MSESVPYADIIILALIAIFILLRLRSVLGSRTGEFPSYLTRMLPAAQSKEKPAQPEDKSRGAKPQEDSDPYLASADPSVADMIGRIKAQDVNFTATSFLQGAKGAYEMVFDAFVKSDRDTLKLLLSDALFQHFSQELDSRAKQENKSETTLVSVKARDISEAYLQGSKARLGVRFSSEQVTVVRGPKGEIVEGDPSQLHHVEDHWTFERDISSKNPNWKIIET